jgi:hypothetical protein
MTFSSGSTGADGALNITTPGVTYFNPQAMNLNPAVPNIFNFTTITIAAGATLKLTEEVFHGPAFFLASGSVDIEGILDLSGAAGPLGTQNQSDRMPSYAGSGGYGGGLGGWINGGPPGPEAGNGPGGGAAGTVSSSVGSGGQFTGNQYLVPLIGGSGGGGSYCGSSNGGQFAGAGGAGGGAILIASSTTITVNGTINANGGSSGNSCNFSGGGSGGAVRLVANTVNGSGAIQDVGSGGASCCFYPVEAGSGYVRLEAYQRNFTGNINGPFAQSVPYSLALPATAPSSITVTSINGVAINANPFSFPDTTINTSSPVVINIQAQYIPPGTVPTLTIFSETGPDQVITASPLSGTLQQSTSTVNITFPTGGSRGFVKATWSQ